MQIVDVNFLADLFNKEPRTIQIWAKDEGMPKEERGGYDLIKCVKWRLRQLEFKIEEIGDEKLYNLKREGQILANRKSEIMLRKLLGEYVEMDAVRLAWLEETKTFSKALDSLTNKLHIALGGKEENMEIIRKEINEVKSMLSDELRINENIDDDIDDIPEEEL